MATRKGHTIDRKDFPKEIQKYLPTDRPAAETAYWGLKMLTMHQDMQQGYVERLEEQLVLQPIPVAPTAAPPHPVNGKRAVRIPKATEPEDIRAIDEAAAEQAAEQGELPQWLIDDPLPLLTVDDQKIIYEQALAMKATGAIPPEMTEQEVFIICQRLMAGWVRKDNGKWLKKQTEQGSPLPLTTLPDPQFLAKMLVQATGEPMNKKAEEIAAPRQ